MYELLMVVEDWSILVPGGKYETIEEVREATEHIGVHGFWLNGMHYLVPSSIKSISYVDAELRGRVRKELNEQRAIYDAKPWYKRLLVSRR